MTRSTCTPDVEQLSPDTRMIHAGGGSAYGIVNMPVFRASTLLFDTVQEYEDALVRRSPSVSYARYGTPSTQAFEKAMTEAEGGYGAAVFPSGLAAIVVALISALGAGDHVLISNAVYGPTRNFCIKTLSRFGVTATFFDPLISDGLEALFQTNTRALFLESPASMTFEVQDVPRLAQLAHARGCKVLIDNTWATPVFFSPFSHGVDISIHSASKYLVGHSDAIMGVAIAADNATYQQLRSAWAEMGQTASSDDCFLALRGLRTLHVRLKRHYQSALQVAEWLRERPEVARVLYPALSQSPGFRIWRRDFTGASGLLGIQLKQFSAAAVARMANGLKLFGIGASWGGHESLILPVNPANLPAMQPDGPLLRLHIGLEDPDDLLRDLEAGFARLTL